MTLTGSANAVRSNVELTPFTLSSLKGGNMLIQYNRYLINYEVCSQLTLFRNS